MKNKDLWKELTIDILNSKALNEAQECLFNCSFIDILDDRTFLSYIFDKIKYFVYKTNFAANTNLIKEYTNLDYILKMITNIFRF